MPYKYHAIPVEPDPYDISISEIIRDFKYIISNEIIKYCNPKPKIN